MSPACPAPGGSLYILLLLTLLGKSLAVERHYYIAAVKIDWDYSSPGLKGSGPTYKKTVYREYEDATFKNAKPHPSTLGLLGPTLRGQEGDVIVVEFRNMVDQPCNIHTHGIAYGKQSEGAIYFDNTSQKEKEDDVVHPGGSHTYTWEVTSAVAPTPADPPCLTYTYFSHVDIVKDFNSGLIGTVLICRAGSLEKSGKQKPFDQEIVLLFGIFDESLSWYGKEDQPANEKKHTINGYTKGTVPGLMVCAYSSVSWHFLGMSSEPEIFSIHFNGQVFSQNGHRVSSIGLISSATNSASMTAVHSGRWLISSFISKHQEEGMYGFLTVKTCEGFTKPERKLSRKEKQQSQMWTYYIAAEEVIWDYSPNMPSYMDEDFKSKYLSQGPHRIGKTYRKAVFTQYEDEHFKKRAENKQRKMEQGIIGPVIRAQIRDQIRIVFKNKASHPYSIYPHGLTIDKAGEGANYPEGGNQTHAVQPGETHTYVWNVIEEDEPLPSDPRCLTRMYHSAVNTPKDIASGMIGPLLICKSESLNKKNVQMKADKEQHAIFAIFDENKSWYLDENIKDFCGDPQRVKKDDPDFYASNIKHTINGYMFESGQVLGFCNGEIVTWHVTSVGEQDRIQTVTFYGHSFELRNRQEDLLSLFPMTGETIKMDMSNKGDWLLSSLNSHGTTKGMRVKFQDVECVRDYVYEYEDDEKFNIWEEKEFLPTHELKTVNIATKAPVIDEDTDLWAEMLDLRSHKESANKTSSSVDILDLSEFDYLDQPLEGKGAENTGSDSVPTTPPELEKPILKNMEHNSTRRNSTKYNTDGNSTVYNTDGNSTVYNTDGNSTVYNTDGNSTVYNTDGNSTVYNTDGNSTVYNILGNTTVSAGFPHEKLIQNTTDMLFMTANETESDIMNGTNLALSNGTSTAIPLLVDLSVPHANSSGSEPSDLKLNNITSDWSERQTNTTNELRHNESLPFTNFSILQSNMSENQYYIENDTESHGSLNAESLYILDGINGTTNETGSQEFAEEEADETTSMPTETTKPYSFNHTTQIFSHVANISEAMESSSSETREYGVLNVSSSFEHVGNSSLESDEWDSSEEVVIYLRNNGSAGVKTHSFNQPKEHWGYEGKHESIPMEMPEEMIKYIENETKPRKEPKKRIVHRKVRPFKGHAMTTKKRKQYKPQPKSSLSPRGFQPRGARPLSSEEDILNKAIVIGVPRSDFHDYDLYAIKDDYQQAESNEEYEYIEFKDPYNNAVKQVGMTMDETTAYILKNRAKGTEVRQYFLSAEEVEWDYGGYGQRRIDTKSDGRLTKFTKVVYRGYLDPYFQVPDIRGEVDEHLGLLGPVIRAEVGDQILIVFRNLASRPFSIHANGVSYNKQMEGLSYVDGTPYFYQEDNAVQTNKSYTYMWQVSSKMGPKDGEPDCRTWAYYSGVNPERDIHSGLIGPLLICRKGTLKHKPVDTREFALLFMTFDETKSWYYNNNYEMIQRRNRRKVMDPSFREDLKFPAINGIIYALKGLRMYTDQVANWHVFNMGAAEDVHSIHFHGQTFLNFQPKAYRQGVYPLLPGAFATLQMKPSKPGLWLLESEVGLAQQRGMQTLILVLDNDCDHPLGLISSSVQDKQISASSTRGYWLPHLARLHNSGKYNAWSTESSASWIQVDFQRPVVISKVATQGAKEMFSSNYVEEYAITYSTDRMKWIPYKGDSDTIRKTFQGNQGAHEVKENIFYPPMIGRFVRLHPLKSYNNPTLRMEYYGCELDGCSVPLGMKSREILDKQIKASSVASNWYAGTWEPWLARLDKQGTVNAWQAKYTDMNQWLQIELPDVKKITGIITQGAKSLGTKMYVSAFVVEYGNDGKRWTKYTDDPDYAVKEFEGNTDNNDHKRNYIYPPIFAKYIKILPRRWTSTITMRVELLGCNFE